MKTPTFRCPFHRVNPPVNKDSQLGIGEPLHLWGDAVSGQSLNINPGGGRYCGLFISA